MVDHRAVRLAEPVPAHRLFAEPPELAALAERGPFWNRIPRLSLLVVDEAHNWYPGTRSRPIGYDTIHTLVHEGRHWQLTMILASQCPADLNRDVWRLVDGVFVFRLADELDLRRIAAVAPELRAVIGEVPRLQDGECFWYRERSSQPVTRVKFPLYVP